MLSAVVLTRNEEKNIDRCLDSLSFCDEIIVIDDYSSDNTVAKIGKKATVLERKLEGNFAAQHNFGLSKTKGDWVLFLDADEVVSKELAQEIVENINKNNFDGFMVKRRDYFLERPLHFGETGNIKLLRLAKKGAGSWSRKVHETWEVKGKIGQLKNPLYHYPHQTIKEFLSSINFYTDLDSPELLKEGKGFNIFRFIFNPPGKFLQNYFLKLGFLDGGPGFAMAFIMSLYSLIVRVKLYEHSL